MSHRLASSPLLRWKPLAPNGRAEGRFNFSRLLCRLEASFLHGTRQVSRQNVYLLYRSLSLIDISREGRRGRQQLPWPPAFSVPVYLAPYHLRNAPSVLPSPFLLADHKRHRNSVAKYLDLSDVFDGGFNDRKSARNKVAPSIASSLTVQGSGWLMRALKA